MRTGFRPPGSPHLKEPASLWSPDPGHLSSLPGAVLHPLCPPPLPYPPHRVEPRLAEPPCCTCLPLHPSIWLAQGSPGTPLSRGAPEESSVWPLFNPAPPTSLCVHLFLPCLPKRHVAPLLFH